MKLQRGRKYIFCKKGEQAEGKLQIEGSNLYACQDKWTGTDCIDKLGYKYSWLFSEISPGKYNAEIDWIKPLYSTDIRDICVGAKVKNMDGEIKEVLGMYDRVITLSEDDNYDIVGCEYTLEELIKHGYTLVTEEPEPEEDEEVKKAIALLESKGRIKDGKILKE